MLRWLGFGLCHQLPERSYLVSGIQAPVCVRDTGIYFGFMIAFALIVVLHRGERPRGFPPAHVWVVMALLLAFMGWDGVSSYAGLRSTTNELRLFTGLGVGFSAAAVVVPMLNDEIWRVSSPMRVLEPTWRFAIWLACIPLAWLAIGGMSVTFGVVFVLLVALSILFTLTAINMVIVLLFPAFDRRAERWAGLLWPAAAALVLTFAEIAAAALIRVLLPLPV